ncbi:MAG TPA: succinate dehydrogenase, cytochrome b556 subunit [Methylococcus sp.]|nr:succinate dehydrogenase, cytochrome b556 subunit [Methylococcus sp.]
MARMNSEVARASRAVAERPLSPHLQIYRLPITAVLSITHRITGVALALGLVALVLLLMSVAQGPDAYAQVQWWLASPFGKAATWGFLIALFFHLSHGIRHLIWDTGHSFSREWLTYYALGELVATLVFTLAVAVATVARS